MIGFKKCECGKNCIPLISFNRIESSEWYCHCNSKSHKSYDMDLETAKYFAAELAKRDKK